LLIMLSFLFGGFPRAEMILIVSASP